ncbi:hypothetical protein PR048_020362 [Dryococelus australis]|uniref:Uncharacterized protein n=1 Tax=Dryococelus australis TaxID=614101 RepID=A0ABQ9H631_9NEOP|nr:hypothetical protein PR048_020362 [Dryococelus australis]
MKITQEKEIKPMYMLCMPVSDVDAVGCGLMLGAADAELLEFGDTVETGHLDRTCWTSGVGVFHRSLPVRKGG